MRLIDYIKGNRRGKAANRLEREAMSDPFLQEALDGFDAVDGAHAEAISRLESKISRRSAAANHRKRITWWSAAATVLLIIGFGSYFLMQKEDNHRQLTVKQIVKMPRQIAKVETKTEKPSIRNSVRFTPPVIKADEQVSDEIAKSQMEVETTVSNNIVSTDQIAELQESVIPQPQPISAPKTTNEITGKVVDEIGQPIIGATIQFADSKRGTVTDTNGEFHLVAEAKDSTYLKASFIGYQSKKIAVSNNNMLIKLNPAYNNLSEVVTVGYGARKKKDREVSVNSKSLEKQTVFDENEFKTYFYKNAKHELCGAPKDSVTAEFVVNMDKRPSLILITNYSCEKAKTEALKWLKKSPDWSTKNKKIKLDLKW
ncbi:MAG: carboxypeptidase-like regulatory domain-containing protein [Bacteroidales bacterium]